MKYYESDIDELFDIDEFDSDGFNFDEPINAKAIIDKFNIDRLSPDRFNSDYFASDESDGYWTWRDGDEVDIEEPINAKAIIDKFNIDRLSPDRFNSDYFASDESDGYWTWRDGDEELEEYGQDDSLMTENEYLMNCRNIDEECTLDEQLIEMIKVTAHRNSYPTTGLATEAEQASLFVRAVLSMLSSPRAQMYTGLLVFASVVAVLCCILAGLAYLLSLTAAQDVEKRSEYECGFAPFDSATRHPFEVHFYVVGILFLIFDVEVALLFPWVLTVEATGVFSYLMMVQFIYILAVGFHYEWKRGALIWPARYSPSRLTLTSAKWFALFALVFTCDLPLETLLIAPLLDTDDSGVVEVTPVYFGPHLADSFHYVPAPKPEDPLYGPHLENSPYYAYWEAKEAAENPVIAPYFPFGPHPENSCVDRLGYEYAAKFCLPIIRQYVLLDSARYIWSCRWLWIRRPFARWKLKTLWEDPRSSRIYQLSTWRYLGCFIVIALVIALGLLFICLVIHIVITDIHVEKKEFYNLFDKIHKYYVANIPYFGGLPFPARAVCITISTLPCALANIAIANPFSLFFAACALARAAMYPSFARHLSWYHYSKAKEWEPRASAWMAAHMWEMERPSRKHPDKGYTDDAEGEDRYRNWLAPVLALSGSVDAFPLVSSTVVSGIDLFTALLPELALATMIIYLIKVVGIELGQGRAKKALAIECLTAAQDGLMFIVLLYTIQMQFGDTLPVLAGYFFSTTGITVAKFFVAVSSLFVLFISDTYLRYHPRNLLEYPLMLLLAILLLLLLIGANNLMTLFLSIGGFSVNLYVLVLFDVYARVSREAAMKYFYLSAVSAGFIIFGTFLTYFSTGTAMFADLRYLFLNQLVTDINIASTGLLFILIGLFFKLSAFPAHLWAAEIYEGSPTPIMAFFLLPVKAAVLVTFARLLNTAFIGLSDFWLPCVAVACAGSLLWGAFAALYERKISRFLGYASINQLGYLLVGVACDTDEALRSMYAYLVLYIMMSGGFLYVFVHARRKGRLNLLYISDFRGFALQERILSWSLTVFLFSSVGIPPLVGFHAKYIVLVSVMQKELFTLAAVGTAVGLLSAYYYLQFVATFQFEEQNRVIPTRCMLSTTERAAVTLVEAGLWATPSLGPAMLPFFRVVAEAASTTGIAWFGAATSSRKLPAGVSTAVACGLILALLCGHTATFPPLFRFVIVGIVFLSYLLAGRWPRLSDIPWPYAVIDVGQMRAGVDEYPPQHRKATIFPEFDYINAFLEQDTAVNLKYGLLFILAISSLTVYSIILAGWSSNSKYAFIGALRSAAQMISYEVAISLILLPVVLMAGSMNITMIVYMQSITVWFLFPLMPAAILFIIAMLAETNRTPFDLPEAEAELVAGYNVDYSALPFAMFFLGEYCNMILISVLFCLLFMGGWTFLGYYGVIVLVIKATLVWFYFIHVRATLPRYRYDQLMDNGWKTFLPVSGGFFIFLAGTLIGLDALPVTAELPLQEASRFAAERYYIISFFLTPKFLTTSHATKIAHTAIPSRARSTFEIGLSEKLASKSIRSLPLLYVKQAPIVNKYLHPLKLMQTPQTSNPTANIPTTSNEALVLPPTPPNQQLKQCSKQSDAVVTTTTTTLSLAAKSAPVSTGRFTTRSLVIGALIAMFCVFILKDGAFFTAAQCAPNLELRAVAEKINPADPRWDSHVAKLKSKYPGLDEVVLRDPYNLARIKMIPPLPLQYFKIWWCGVGVLKQTADMVMTPMISRTYFKKQWDFLDQATEYFQFGGYQFYCRKQMYRYELTGSRTGPWQRNPENYSSLTTPPAPPGLSEAAAKAAIKHAPDTRTFSQKLYALLEKQGSKVDYSTGGGFSENGKIRGTKPSGTNNKSEIAPDLQSTFKSFTSEGGEYMDLCTDLPFYYAFVIFLILFLLYRLLRGGPYSSRKPAKGLSNKLLAFILFIPLVVGGLVGLFFASCKPKCPPKNVYQPFVDYALRQDYRPPYDPCSRLYWPKQPPSLLERIIDALGTISTFGWGVLACIILAIPLVFLYRFLKSKFTSQQIATACLTILTDLVLFFIVLCACFTIGKWPESKELFTKVMADIPTTPHSWSELKDSLTGLWSKFKLYVSAAQKSPDSRFSCKYVTGLLMVVTAAFIFSFCALLLVARYLAYWREFRISEFIQGGDMPVFPSVGENGLLSPEIIEVICWRLTSAFRYLSFLWDLLLTLLILVFLVAFLLSPIWLPAFPIYALVCRRGGGNSSSTLAKSLSIKLFVFVLLGPVAVGGLVGLLHGLLNLIVTGAPVILNLVLPLGAIVFASLVVLLRNPMHSLLALIGVFLLTVVVYIAVGAEFLGLVFLIVYVGAVAILFLFVIMLLNVRSLTSDTALIQRAAQVVGLVVNLLLVFVLLYRLIPGFFTQATKFLFLHALSKVDALIYYVNYGAMDVMAFATLYTEQAALFILITLILLVAMLGAIVLATATLDEEEPIERAVSRPNCTASTLFSERLQAPTYQGSTTNTTLEVESPVSVPFFNPLPVLPPQGYFKPSPQMRLLRKFIAWVTRPFKKIAAFCKQYFPHLGLLLETLLTFLIILPLGYYIYWATKRICEADWTHLSSYLAGSPLAKPILIFLTKYLPNLPLIALFFPLADNFCNFCHALFHVAAEVRVFIRKWWNSR